MRVGVIFLSLIYEVNQATMINVAINGYGRIGRNILRALYEGGYRSKLCIKAINDLGDAKTNAHLTQYDTTHGLFQRKVSAKADAVKVGRDVIQIFAERDPEKLPWSQLDIDVVFECTGLFTDRNSANKHLLAGAKKVLISAPSNNSDATIVYGVNDNVLTARHQIISNASCTTNCLAPIAKILNNVLGIESGTMTTIHSYTNDQSLLDLYHTDLRRARCATQSMIPAKTGAAQAIGLVLPELAGKLSGVAIRVPTTNVSLVDFTFIPGRCVTSEEVNAIMRTAVEQNSLKGVLAYNDLPLVSQDFNHNSASSIFDASLTQVVGQAIQVMAWYDNEWGFSNRMLDNALVLGNLNHWIK